MKQRIYDLLISENTLQDFTDAAARLIDTPFWIMDETFRFLAVSRTPSAMPLAKEMLLKQSIYAWAGEWMKEGLDETIRESGKPLHIEDAFLRRPVVVTNIMNQKTLLGRMTFFVNEDRMPADSLIEQISACCGVYLRDAAMDINAGLKANFLLSLLEGRLNERETGEAAMLAGFACRPPYRLMAMKTEKESRRNRELIGLSLTQIRGTMNETAAVLSGECGFVLFPEIYSFDTVFRDGEMKAGVSLPFDHLSLIHSARIQAEFALEKGTGPLTGFEDVYTDYFRCLLRNSVDASCFLFPKARAVMDYDQTYGTQYMKTLEIYIENSCSKEKTAKALDLHLNTVKYRLRQCEELFGIDLKKDREALRISLLLAE